MVGMAMVGMVEEMEGGILPASLLQRGEACFWSKEKRNSDDPFAASFALQSHFFFFEIFLFLAQKKIGSNQQCPGKESKVLG